MKSNGTPLSRKEKSEYWGKTYEKMEKELEWLEGNFPLDVKDDKSRPYVNRLMKLSTLTGMFDQMVFLGDVPNFSREQSRSLSERNEELINRYFETGKYRRVIGVQ